MHSEWQRERVGKKERSLLICDDLLRISIGVANS